MVTSATKCRLVSQATGSYVPRHLDVEEWHVEENRRVFEKETLCIAVPLLFSSALLSSLCATKPCGHLEWAKACWKASPQQKHHYPLIRYAHRLLNYLSYTIYGFDDQSDIFILFKLVCMVTKHCVCPCLVTRQMFRSTCLVKHIVYTFLDIFH